MTLAEDKKKTDISKKKEVVLGKILTIEQFLKKYAKDINQKNLDDAFKLKFKIDKERTTSKLSTFIRKATVEDSRIISNLFKEIYKGTYPYKHLEDKQKVAEMIESGNTEWVLFETKDNKIAGGFGADFYTNEKKGLLYGFCILKPYRDRIDSLKAFMGSLIYFWTKYSNKIPVWMGEVRTFDTAPQWGPSFCSLKPIAFYPNKDIFFNKIESEFLSMTYLGFDFLKNNRSKKIPKMIWPVLGAYSYSTKRYKLGEFKVENPQLSLNNSVIRRLTNSIKIEEIPDKYNNKIVIFTLGESKFQFFHNFYSRNIEKIHYKIESLEELQTFINCLKKYMKQNNINYFQCFVSAYEPAHQQVFLENGFWPRGYVPCWKFDLKTKSYEDHIVFNYYSGELAKGMKLIKESKDLLKSIGFYNELEKEKLLKALQKF